MGITHKWNGTVLTITSDSGTSSADLKGEKGDKGCRGAQGKTGFTIGADGTIDTTGFATESYVDSVIESSLEEIQTTVKQSVQTNEATADLVSLKDANDGGIINITAYGKTIQKEAPAPEAPVELLACGMVNGAKIDVVAANKNMFNLTRTNVGVPTNGITSEFLSDGSVRIYGKTEDTSTEFFDNVGYMLLGAGKYRLTGSDGKTVRLRVSYRGTSNIIGQEAGSGLEFELTEQSKISFAIRSIASSKTDTSYNTIIYPMLTALDADKTFEKHESNKMKIEAELYGVPVKASEGSNYIDEQAQHWVSDAVDVKNKKLIRRVKKIVIDGSIGNYDTNANMYMVNISSDAKTAGFDKNSALCSHYPFASYSNADMPDKSFKIHTVTSTGSTYIYIKDTRFTTTTDFRAWLTENPITVIYQLKEPQEIDLEDSKIISFDKLKTYKPMSTVSCTNYNVGLKVNYMIDIKSYIDNKFNELQAALISLGGNV